MDSRKLVLQQTGIVSVGVAIGVAAMIGIFALLGKFALPVLLGGVIGGFLAVLNFFVMALSVNIAAGQDVKGGQATVRFSYLLRTVVLFVVLFAFAKSGICNVIALVLPLIFVRPTLTVAEFFTRKPGEKKE